MALLKTSGPTVPSGTATKAVATNPAVSKIRVGVATASTVSVPLNTEEVFLITAKLQNVILTGVKHGG